MATKHTPSSELEHSFGQNKNLHAAALLDTNDALTPQSVNGGVEIEHVLGSSVRGVQY
jgi:hypothetical protein